MALKAVIFNAEGVLFKDRATVVPDAPTGFALRGGEIRAELQALFEFLRARGVRPIILTNREWTARDDDAGRSAPVDEALRTMFGEHRLYVAMRGDVPLKPQRECLTTLLAKERLQREEVVMVGTSMADFKTATNADVLFLNATWDRQEVAYGFTFGSPWEIRRFVDLFALREHPWFYAIDEGPVRFRSLAPYTTLTGSDQTRAYSAAAEAAAKRATEDRHFFLNSLVSSLYFSGLAPGAFDYIAAIPGHRAGFGNPAMDDNLAVLGGIFRTNYLRDLIVRHTDAPSSRQTRRSSSTPLVETQFNTIHLTRRPLKKGDEPYKNSPLKAGKRVLVLDDFATGGVTLEAARNYLAQAGVEAVLVTWLKTITRPYQIVTPRRRFDPFGPQAFTSADFEVRALPYHAHIADPGAREELGDAFQRYQTWRP